MKYLILTYLLNIIDYLFTGYWVSKYGLSIEGNPIGRWMFENNIAWLFKIVVVGVLLIALGFLINKYKRYKWIPIILAIIYGLIVVYHIVIAIYIA